MYIYTYTQTYTYLWWDMIHVPGLILYIRFCSVFTINSQQIILLIITYWALVLVPRTVLSPSPVKTGTQGEGDCPPCTSEVTGLDRSNLPKASNLSKASTQRIPVGSHTLDFMLWTTMFLSTVCYFIFSDHRVFCHVSALWFISATHSLWICKKLLIFHTCKHFSSMTITHFN